MSIPTLKEQRMRRLSLFAAVAAVLLSLGGSFALADGGDTAVEKPVTNKMCPFMGEPTNPKFRTEYNGQYVYFCCAGCVDTFKANPEAAIAKLSDEDRAAIQKNTACPISGETIENWDTKTEYNGKLVYFCCPMCKDKFEKSHPPAK
jgi:YHS domain-containing protein